MKWTELVDRVVLQFGTNPHNKAIARKFLEEAERDLAFYTKCYLKDKTIVANTDDNFFDMPNDFLELKSPITANEHQLEPYRDQINRVKSDGSQVTGAPRYYLLTSKQIILVPHPDEETVINFQYIAQPNAVDKDKTYKKINYKALDNGFFKIGDTVKGSKSGISGIVHQDINDLKTGTLVLSDVTTESATSTFVTTLSTLGGSSTLGGVPTNIHPDLPNSGELTFQNVSSETVILQWTGKASDHELTGIKRISDPNTWSSSSDSSGSGTTITWKGLEFSQNETLFTMDDAYDLAQISGNYTWSTLSSSWDSLGLSARATSSSVALDWTDNDILSPIIPEIYHLYLVDYAKSMLAENEKEFELSDRFMAKYRSNRESVRGQISGKGTGSGTMVVADLSFRGSL